jgi:hypothetical protein
MKAFHGTTKKGLNAILNGGSKPNCPWTVSDNDGMTYVWPLDKLVSANALEDDDASYQTEYGIRQAFESAEIQAVMEESEAIFVIELDIPDELLEDDFSCENMDNVASVLHMNDFDLKFIKKVYIADLNKWSFPFIVSGLLQNEHFNRWAVDEQLVEIAESLTDVYREPTEFNYSEYSI